VMSDRQDVTFGIQHVASELTPEGHRLFKVNGRPLLIRGGGWASDMLLRPAPTARLEAEMRYVKEMGLNTIRLEGKLETDEFYDLADRHGILLMPGWCCCDQWEMWDKWDAEDHQVAPASLKDQILRIRNHPSVLVWLNGSDFPPPADVERRYLDVLTQCEWSKPVLSNATDAPGPLSGPSGVKMKGPYDYVPPSYWLKDTKNGGAFGFATEIGPGAAVPPIESLRQMLPPDHMWPIDDFWRFHAGGDEFKDLRRFTEALEARYGRATGVADYARKAQALAYEGERAMFEGYARNKYVSTGVIQWMLNNAWPSMIWHLYDYYLRPGGGYFGTKKANEPVHVQYSYDDRSVVVVNDLYDGVNGLRVSVDVFDLQLVSKFSREATINLQPDSVARVLTVPSLSDITTTYFLRLRAVDAGGREVSRNFYWLSTRDDVLDWQNTKWYYTPTTQHADLRALAQLPPTTVTVSPRFEGTGTPGTATVSVRNSGRALAFQVRLKLIDPRDGREILPVYWADNYFELFPGETREIRVSYPAVGRQPRVEVEAWNVTS
jgi:exo-1,4-beta-D-glucosaminidase